MYSLSQIMIKGLICLTLALFIVANAQFTPIPIPAGSKNITDEVLKVTLANFIKKEQASNRLPSGTFDVEAKSFNNVYLTTFVTDPPVISKLTDSYQYILELRLKSQSAKTYYDIRLEPIVNLQNTSITGGTDTLLASYNASAWASIKVINNTKGKTQYRYEPFTIINNVQLQAEVFQSGVKQEQLDNFYFKTVSRTLTQLILEYSRATYVYDIKVLDIFSGKTISVIANYSLTAEGAWALQHPDYVFVYIKLAEEPLVDADYLTFSNTTKLTYNPLALMWNKDVKKAIEERTTNFIKNLSLSTKKEVVKGRYNISQNEVKATFLDGGVEIFISSYIRAKSKDWTKSFTLTTLVDASTNAISIVNSFLTPAWACQKFVCPKLNLTSINFARDATA